MNSKHAYNMVKQDLDAYKLRFKHGVQATYELLNDYSVTFYTYDLQHYIHMFQADSVPYVLGQCKADSGVQWLCQSMVLLHQLPLRWHCRHRHGSKKDEIKHEDQCLLMNLPIEALVDEIKNGKNELVLRGSVRLRKKATEGVLCGLPRARDSSMRAHAMKKMKETLN